MGPDIQKYWPFVDGFDLSRAEKLELIHTVWGMAEGFVDRGLGTDPVQATVKQQGPKSVSAPPAVIELKRIAVDIFGDEEGQ